MGQKSSYDDGGAELVPEAERVPSLLPRARALRAVQRLAKKPPLEKSIEKYFKAECKKLGFEAFKLTSPGQRGVPDQMVLADNGVIGFAEIKRPGGRASKLQLHVGARMTSKGAIWDILYSKKDVDSFLSEIAEKSKKV